MKRLGISIYPEKSTKEEIFAYLDMAVEAGFSRIFSCLLSVQVTKEAVVQKFSDINAYAHRLGFEIILDANPQVLRSLASRMEISRSLRRSVRTAFALI